MKPFCFYTMQRVVFTDPPPPVVWVCYCGHEEAAHAEDPRGLWPCVTSPDCRCVNFEVWQ